MRQKWRNLWRLCDRYVGLFALLIGLFCSPNRSLLHLVHPDSQVCIGLFCYLVGVFCLYIRPLLTLVRQEMEREQGFSIPRSLPMMGGTTATTAIVVKKYLSLAWVGDSRAVLCAVGYKISKVLCAVRYQNSKGLNTVRILCNLRGHLCDPSAMRHVFSSTNYCTRTLTFETLAFRLDGALYAQV